MAGRPGRLQTAFTAGEIDRLLYERDELKYFSSGLSRAENAAIMVQGGFRARAGLRDIGGLNSSASRVFPFSASNGEAFDIVLKAGAIDVWSKTGLVTTLSLAALTPEIAGEATFAQQLDTMLIFHRDLKTQRLIVTDGGWSVGDAPFTGIPRHDYGGTYSNGVAAVWQIEFVGLSNGNMFNLTVAGQETAAIAYSETAGTLASNIEAALDDLPNLAAGHDVAHASGNRFNIIFSGTGNEGDGWAVSGRVINNAESAILAYKTVAGVLPGEDLFSAERGWPQCGVFYQQRLLLGGFKSLPNAWMFSILGDYFNFDDRLTGAEGAALVPMDLPGGESIEHIVDNRNLLIFTSGGEYWLAERALSKTSAPNHVQASTHGTRRGVPVVNNEGAALFIHRSGGVLGEARYTDVEGNFVSVDLSLLARHLVADVNDMASRKARSSADGNQVAMVLGDGAARVATVLREQETTAFARMTSGTGAFHAVSVNARNEMRWIVERAAGRRLEMSEDGLLLDEAMTMTLSPVQDFVDGLWRFEGRVVWCLGDGYVFGPYTVGGGRISLPIAIGSATVGTWSPPLVRTLPLPRTIGPHMVLKRKGRIHTVVLDLIDTTSVAVGVNGGPVRDIDLMRWGMPADVPELDAPFSGRVRVPGLTGYADELTVTVSQVRPGKLTVRSITAEALL